MKPPKPRRIQLSRAKGWRTPASAVKVDRTTPFGNPFSIEDWGHDRAVALHRAWLTGGAIDAPLPAAGLKRLGAQRAQVLEALPGLRGKDLACWCALPQEGKPDTCHAALLL